MNAYYNDNDGWCAEFLRHRFPGATVDARSIVEVRGSDVAGFERVHWFAGLGGWELALDLAGWPAGVPVWSGSCPCQPFSVAGKRRGLEDERHLWPEFRRLIEECRPAIVFGEQVGSKDGRVWLSRVRADLEALDYAVGAADLCAAGTGAPHIRQRLYWVAVANDAGPCAGRSSRGGSNGHSRHADMRSAAPEHGGTGGLADSDGTGQRIVGRGGLPGDGDASRGHDAERCGEAGGLADSDDASTGRGALGPGEGCGSGNGAARERPERLRSPRIHPAWDSFEWLPCLDGTWRRTQVGTEVCSVADGLRGRVDQLRALGNSIVPPLAAEFVGAVMDVLGIAHERHGDAQPAGGAGIVRAGADSDV